MSRTKTPFIISILLVSIFLPKLALAEESKDRLPLCASEKVISTAIEAIEDMYVGVGLTSTHAKIFTDVVQALQPYAKKDLKSTERNFARNMGYGVEHVRICASSIYEDALIVVYVLSLPQNLNKWVLLVQNIGLGPNAMAESLPMRK